ncbi:MBL fold metallo-hydrolase [Patescibacteria group bacterium]|nr:MBL fold metallo-hydrolase [Patescibacteria group bacterium]
MKKIIKILIGLIIILSVLLAIVHYSDQENNLQVYFFDIGQGDGMLIRTPSHHNIIIDGGPDNTFITKLGQTLPFYDKTIDLMILTHPHDDHLFGLVEVLKRYKVKQILATGVEHSSNAYFTWLELIKEKDIPFKIALSGQQFIFKKDCSGKYNCQSNEVIMEVIYPFEDLSSQEADNLNETSVVTQLRYEQIKILFTGDLEKGGEEKILDYLNSREEKADFNLRSQVLKVGHHGSKTSSILPFLKAIDPQYAIIQVGQDNKFNHPFLEVLKNLERLGAEIYRNDLKGDILLFSNGQDVNIKASF